MIFEKIKTITADQLGIDDKIITLKTSFTEDLGADSLDLFQIVMDIEEEYDIKIEEVEGLDTVEDAVNFVKERIAHE